MGLLENMMSKLDDNVEAGESTAALESQLFALKDQIKNLPEGADPAERARLQLEIARTLVGIGDDKADAWTLGQEAFGVFMQLKDWEKVVEACDVMFLSEHEDALIALGHGVWLGVTFPIDPELTISMLQHIIDETPDDSDGAAVAAATAAYIADLRGEGKERDNLVFFTNQMLGTVARRHGEVESQDQFDFWINKMELNQPDKFLVRLRNVVDVLVQEHWWFDRDKIRDNLPEN